MFRDPPASLAENGVVVTIWYRAPELLLMSKHYTPAIGLSFFLHDYIGLTDVHS